METTNVAELMRGYFDAVRGPELQSAQAETFGVSPSTYSRILLGKMPFTKERFGQWMEALEDSPAKESLSSQLRIVVAQQEAARLRPTVEDFVERAKSKRTGISVHAISDLFSALSAPHIKNALVCIDYPDFPRAAIDGQYTELGEELAKSAICGVAIAMFMRFGESRKSDTGGLAQLSVRPSGHVRSYMTSIRNMCRRAYRSFVYSARKQQPELLAQGLVAPQFEKSPIEHRLRLYELVGGENMPGPVFGAKLFYISWYDMRRNEPDRLVLQWVPAHKEDILVVREPDNIDYNAVRDSFYPIPHIFTYIEQEKETPVLPKLQKKTLLNQLSELEELLFTEPPEGMENIWTTYEKSSN